MEGGEEGVEGEEHAGCEWVVAFKGCERRGLEEESKGEGGIHSMGWLQRNCQGNVNACGELEGERTDVPSIRLAAGPKSLWASAAVMMFTAGWPFESRERMESTLGKKDGTWLDRTR